MTIEIPDRCTFTARWEFENAFGWEQEAQPRENAERGDRVVGAFIAACEGLPAVRAEMHTFFCPERGPHAMAAYAAGLRLVGFAPTADQVQDPLTAWKQAVELLDGLIKAPGRQAEFEAFAEVLLHIPLDLAKLPEFAEAS